MDLSYNVNCKKMQSSWSKSLLDTTLRNQLLKITKSSALDFTYAYSNSQAEFNKIFSSTSRLLSVILQDTANQTSNPGQSLQQYEDLSEKIRKRIAEAKLELGIDMGKLTFGIVEFQLNGKDYRAPLFMVDFFVEKKTRTSPASIRAEIATFKLNSTLEFVLYNQGYNINLMQSEISNLIRDVDSNQITFTNGLSRLLKNIKAESGGFFSSGSIPRNYKFNLEVIGKALPYQKIAAVQEIEDPNFCSRLTNSAIGSAIAGDSSALSVISSAGKSIPINEKGADKITPSDEFLVLDADPSQNYAIDAVLAGLNVIIEGPPGTGKSQTISNIIASSMSKGKKILFVAEKQAAIEAVVKRLSKVGLDDLVMDLGAGRGNKANINIQLQKANSLLATKLNYSLPLTNHDKARQDLLDYYSELHAPIPKWADKSFFELNTRKLELEKLLLSSNPKMLNEFLSKDLSYFTSNALLSGISTEINSYQDLQKILGLLVEITKLNGFQPRSDLGCWGTVTRASDASKVVEYRDAARQTFEEVTALWTFLPNFLSQLGVVNTPQKLEEIEELIVCLDALLLASLNWNGSIWDTKFREEIERSTASKEIKKANNWKYSFREKKIYLKLAKHTFKGKPTKKEIYSNIVTFNRAYEMWRKFSEHEGKPNSSNLEKAKTILDSAQAKIQDLENRLELPQGELAQENILQIQSTINKLLVDIPVLVDLFRLNKAEQTLSIYSHISSIYQFKKELYDAKVSNKFAEQVGYLFEYLWINFEIENDILIRKTSQNTALDNSNSKMENFQESDRTQIASAADRLKQKIQQNYIAWVSSRNPMEITQFEVEIKKKSNILPPKQLLSNPSYQEHCLEITPCWAMSPLLVSQILPTNINFDIVIFDEASQIKPSDAILPLLRGKQFVICGDSKQLPPTSFFDNAGSDMEDDEYNDAYNASDIEEGTGSLENKADGNLNININDSESILDVLNNILPLDNKHMLQWHYRSRDPRLIEFSNTKYYKGKLKTLPGTNSKTPLGLHVVTSPNSLTKEEKLAAEADFVVDKIIAHYRQYPDRTLGVIAFGSKQAIRISNALNKKILQMGTSNPDQTILAKINNANSSIDGLFIKNLERVQGDERDHIIISLGYASDSNRKVHKGFGPISIKGGERRLNVAVSRAKDEVLVISSFDPSEIVPEKGVGSEGARDLYDYLVYAQSGWLEDSYKTSESVPMNPFEQDIYDRLINAGVPKQAIEPQYKTAGYRLDFAIKCQQGQYILAVEADGASYHSSETARLRDRLRQEHLESLGWVFYRIWSTDYFKNPQPQISGILSALDHLCNSGTKDALKTSVAKLPLNEHPAYEIPSNPVEPPLSESLAVSSIQFKNISNLESKLDNADPKLDNTTPSIVIKKFRILEEYRWIRDKDNNHRVGLADDSSYLYQNVNKDFYKEIKLHFIDSPFEELGWKIDETSEDLVEIGHAENKNWLEFWGVSDYAKGWVSISSLIEEQLVRISSEITHPDKTKSSKPEETSRKKTPSAKQEYNKALAEALRAAGYQDVTAVWKLAKAGKLEGFKFP